MNNQKLITITKKDIEDLIVIIKNIKFNYLRDYKIINKLLKAFIKEKISYECYKKSYKEILHTTNNNIYKFKFKFIKLYLYNIIQKKLNKDTIELYKDVNFDNIVNSLKLTSNIGIVPNNVFETIINYDLNKCIQNLSYQNICVEYDNNIDSCIKKFIPLINNEIQNKLNEEKTLLKK